MLPPSKFTNIWLGHRDAVAEQIVRSVMARSDDLGRIIDRVRVAYALLDDAFDQEPERIAEVVDATFQRMGELQEREFSLDPGTREVPDDKLESKFGSYLDLYEFTHEQFYCTLAAPYVAADAITRTGETVGDLVDADGRATPQRMEALETGRGIRAGCLTEGLNRHLRNSAAHHRYKILSDDRIRLWDMNPRTGQTSWGPVEWTFWDFRTNIYRLSNTCSVLLLGLAMFDISHGRTIRARGWGLQEAPRPKRRDIVKSELQGMAAAHGFTVDKVEVAEDVALVISLRVKGDTMIDQTTEIVSGIGDRVSQRFQQKVRTEWGDLRRQVYGFLQTTLDAHGGYDVVRVTVVGDDGETSLGEVEAPLAERHAMWREMEEIDAIRVRLSLDTLADKKIPIIIKGPIAPSA